MNENVSIQCRYLYWLVFGLLYLIAFTADAQNNVPINTVNGEYIKEWLVLGPFFPDDLGKDFLADAGGEENVNPKEGDTVTTKDGKTLTWKRYRIEEDETNLIKAVGGHERATAYAFCILRSDSTGNGAMYLGSDDGMAIETTSDGVLWFGTEGGVTRYDGESFTTLDTQDGLAFGDGWRDGGLTKYEPDTGLLTTFTVADGSTPAIWTIERDAADVIWIGAQSGGLCRYDGKVLTHVTKGWDNQPTVFAIHIATDGVVWFGGSRGVYRYDRQGFIHFTEDGIYSRDGDQFVLRTPELRLPDLSIWTIHRTEDGVMWFGTESHGIVGYDGTALTTIDTRDGIAGNSVFSFQEDSAGFLWIGTTDGGLTRYRRGATSPGIRIRKVMVDDIEHTDLNAIPNITAGHHISILYQEIDFKTHPQKRQYQLKTRAEDGETLKSSLTKERRYDWTPEKAGSYTFEVKAIDRDLNYSQPASVTFTIVPLWYRNGWIAIPSGGAILAMLFVSILLASRYYVQRRESQRLRERMLEQERQKNAELSESYRQVRIAKDATEAAKEEADSANQAKSVFLANMSHEIRTPLNAVLGYAQILQRDASMPSKHRDAVETIERSGTHLLGLINDILDLSKIEAGRLELHEINFGLKGLVDDISSMFSLRCQQQGLEWRLEGLEGKVLVHGDEGKLKQVLINLLGNAVKFTDAGAVTLGIHCESEGIYRFDIIDTGHGIPKEAQVKILEPFAQHEQGEKKGGTGLGLTISSRQIQLMGGKLLLESEVGKGARFFFSLPLSTAFGDVEADAAKEQRTVLHLADGYHAKTLAVDDIKENRDVLEKLLTDIGVEVVLAENGKEALERVRTEAFDLVFMDIHMPVMDGLQAAKAIVKEFGKNHPKLVAITSSVLTHERQEYLESGFDDFVPKPFRLELLCECMADLLGVEYEYAYPPPTQVADDSSQLILSQITLPVNLLEQLKAAAEYYSVTELNDLTKEMEALGEKEHQLAEHLRQLVQQVKMAEILTFLDQIRAS